MKQMGRVKGNHEFLVNVTDTQSLYLASVRLVPVSLRMKGDRGIGGPSRSRDELRERNKTLRKSAAPCNNSTSCWVQRQVLINRTRPLP
jgi:hypothetical protein